METVSALALHPASADEATRDKVAVIGAGFVGLGVMAALRRRGIPFDAFEADDDVGGNWYHGVYETAHIISSRKTTEYADVPMPETYPDFPSARQMLAYLRDYADRYRLRPHIRFDTRVERVEPVEPGGAAGWRVALSSGETRHYKGVIVCNGHHWRRRFPSYPGLFAGETMHAKDYKGPDVLKGKRVLVVGGGNSGCDIAVEAARFAEAAHISLRRGYWFIPRTLLGVPTVELTKGWMPLPLQRAVLRLALALVVGDYRRYGLQKPRHKLFERHPTINSDLLQQFKLGRITPCPDVERLCGDEVAFVDGTRAAFDLIVYATGYDVCFPFFPEGLIAWQNGMPQLIGGTLHPRHRGLYVMGLGQVRYGVGPLITAGAEALCTMIETQDRLSHPLGAVLQRMGARPLTTYLVGPFRLLRQTRRLRRLLPLLPRLEPLLMRGFGRVPDASQEAEDAP